MRGFTAEEKREFRFKKYVREHMADFFISLLGHTLLTELVVCLCGGTRFWLAFLLALAYTIWKWLYALYIYKKEWLEVDVRERGSAKKTG